MPALYLLLRNWRLVAIGMAALGVFAFIASQRLQVRNLQNRVETLQISLANEQTARRIAEDTIGQMKRAAAKAQEDIYQLEADNKKDQENWIATLKIVDDLEDCEVPAAEKPAAENSTPTVKSSNDSVDRLNQLNADVNRMLERIGQ